MEVDPSLVEVRRGVEGDAALGDRTVEVLDRAEVLVGERLVEHRPEAFGRLQLGAVGRQVDEPDTLGDGQPRLRVPARVVEDEDDDPNSLMSARLFRRRPDRIALWERRRDLIG